MRLERLRLINQHNGNIVTNFVAQPAAVTDELVRILAILEFALALRAHENFQQLLIEH